MLTAINEKLSAQIAYSLLFHRRQIFPFFCRINFVFTNVPSEKNRRNKTREKNRKKVEQGNKKMLECERG
jgi:hypothetical protein